MNIIALDLSLTATGLVSVHGQANVIEWAPVPKSSKGGMTVAQRGTLHRARLAAAAMRAEGWFNTWTLPDLLAMEGYSFGSKDGSAFDRAELRGIIRYTAMEWDVPVVEVSPGTIKMFGTGKGNAAKVEMVSAARERLGMEGHDENVADALWLWHLCHQYLGTGQSTVVLPKTHLKALEGKINDIDWRGLK